MTTSASCSIDPDSRKSESIGLLSCRCSRFLLSWDSATTGHSSSRAKIFKLRLISDTSTCLFSARIRPLMS